MCCLRFVHHAKLKDSWQFNRVIYTSWEIVFVIDNKWQLNFNSFHLIFGPIPAHVLPQQVFEQDLTTIDPMHSFVLSNV